MKVIILNGSPKAKGNTATALREVENTLHQQGIETEWIHVGNKDIRGCIACNGCWKSGLCAFDDIAEVAYFAASAPEHMQVAEILVMPTYQATGTIVSKK